MSRIVYISGGARSGKSNFAEKKASVFHPHVAYIATAKPIDDEMVDRIKKHKLKRPEQWQTLEGYKDMDKLVSKIESDKKVVILDCITIMVTNLMLEYNTDWDNIKPAEIECIESKIIDEINKLIKSIRERDLCLFVVSNELGMGLVPTYKMGRIFRDIAGRVNQLLAKEADEVYFMISGIPLKLK